MKKKLTGFVLFALIALFHIDVFATSSINAFSQPSESNSFVNQLFHQALNSLNKFFSHSNGQPAAAVNSTDMQAAITKFYVTSNEKVVNKNNNQNSAFFDKNNATTRDFVSSDGKPTTESERAFC